MGRVICKLQTESVELSRVQEHLVTVLNPLIRSMAFLSVRYTTATQPKPCVELAGVFVRVKNPGDAEQLFVCLEDSGGTWEWVSMALSS